MKIRLDKNTPEQNRSILWNEIVNAINRITPRRVFVGYDKLGRARYKKVH